jgi:hypothetical protein
MCWHPDPPGPRPSICSASLTRTGSRYQLFALAVLTACVQLDGDNRTLADVEWPYYGGDAAGTKYSPLREINRTNVQQLQRAWSVRMGDFPPAVFDPLGHRAGDRRADGVPIDPRRGRQCGACHDMHLRFEATPIMRDGSL